MIGRRVFATSLKPSPRPCRRVHYPARTHLQRAHQSTSSNDATNATPNININRNGNDVSMGGSDKTTMTPSSTMTTIMSTMMNVITANSSHHGEMERDLQKKRHGKNVELLLRGPEALGQLHENVIHFPPAVKAHLPGLTHLEVTRDHVYLAFQDDKGSLYQHAAALYLNAKNDYNYGNNNDGDNDDGDKDDNTCSDGSMTGGEAKQKMKDEWAMEDGEGASESTSAMDANGAHVDVGGRTNTHSTTAPFPSALIPVDVRNLTYCGGGATIILSRGKVAQYLLRGQHTLAQEKPTYTISSSAQPTSDPTPAQGPPSLNPGQY